MMNAIFKAGIHYGLIAAVALSLSIAPANAEERAVAGQFTASYSKREALPVPDAEGHVLMLGEAAGRNVGLKGSDYMDGATIVNREILDLVRGNGPHSGYVTMTMAGVQTVSRWEGTVRTSLNKDGTPNTTFEGTWTKVNGTGKYERVTGGGTYSGHFTSENDYVVDWNGRLDFSGK